MARAYGRSASLLLKREATFGTDPGGNFLKLPFLSTNLGKSIGLLPQQRAGLGRTQREIFQGPPDVSGDISMPLCMRNIGYLLTGLLGDPTTTGASAPYTHTFTSEETELPSYAIEVGHPNVPAYYLNLGCMVNAMELNFSREGGAQAKFSLLGQSEAKATSSEGGTPTTQTLSWASQFEGTVKEGSTALANLNSARLNYSNNLVGVDTVNQTDGQLEGIDPGDAVCTGSLNARFASTALLDDATSGAPVDLDFIYLISASLSLGMTVHEAYLEKPKLTVEGPGGINADLNFHATYNSSNSKMLTAVLINDQAGTVYTT